MNKKKVKFVLDILKIIIFVIIPLMYKDKISSFLVPDEYADVTVSSPMGFILSVGLITIVCGLIYGYIKVENLILSKIKDK